MSEKMVVTRYRPWRAWLVAFLAPVLVLGVGAFSYLLGSRHFDSAMAEKRVLSREVKTLRQSLDRLEREKVIWTMTGQVNRASLAQVQRELARREERMAEQQRELYLYRNLLADSGGSSGLYIGDLELRAGATPRQFEYQLAVRRKGALTRTVDVRVSLFIDGVREGADGGKAEPHTLPLSEADPSQDEPVRSVRFRYFNILSGILEIPAGFTPEQVRVEVTTDEGGHSDEKVFDWLVEEV